MALQCAFSEVTKSYKKRFNIFESCHSDQLGDKGISEEVIPVLRDLLLNHKPETYKPINLPKNHTCYDVYYMYKGNYFVVGIGDN